MALRNRRPLLAIVVAVAIVSAIVVIAVTTSSEDGPEPGIEVGFNNNSVAQGLSSPERAAELIAGAGGEIDRVQIDWDLLEPERGRYRWDAYDAIYRADLARGLRPLFIFAYAPAWANGGICPAVDRGCHAPPVPEHVDDAARTAAEIARRYPRAAGIEIWNEPNLPYFWRPAPDASAYAELLERSSEAIKAVDPEMTVAGGSTSDSMIERPGQIEAADFVGAILDAGAADSMDALSVHVYPDPADASGRSAVIDLEAVAGALGDEEKPIWVTETGISTSGPDAVSLEAQSLALVSLYEDLAAVPDVGMVLIHTLIRPSLDPASPETGFGIVGPDLVPTATYCDLAAAWNGPGDPCPTG